MFLTRGRDVVNGSFRLHKREIKVRLAVLHKASWEVLAFFVPFSRSARHDGSLQPTLGGRIRALLPRPTNFDIHFYRASLVRVLRTRSLTSRLPGAAAAVTTFTRSVDLSLPLSLADANTPFTRTPFYCTVTRIWNPNRHVPWLAHGLPMACPWLTHARNQYISRFSFRFARRYGH